MKKRKYTYKLYPSEKQKVLLIEQLRLHQELYNGALQERIDCYLKTGKSLTYNDQQASLTIIRSEIEEYRNIPVFFGRMTLRRLDKAFKSFFRRVDKGQTPGFPRYKSLNRFNSFEMCSHGQGWKFAPGGNWKHGKLFVKNIGHIKARGRARSRGEVKTSQVIYRHGQWWLSLTVDCEPERLPSQTKACGLDWGVQYLASLTEENGNTVIIENPRYYQNSKGVITELAQAVSSKRRGSGRWRRACKRLANARSLQARQRKDAHHKIAANIADTYALVATEKLTIKNMTGSAKGTIDAPGKMVPQKAGLNREILDTAPRMLLDLIRYKVEETGGEFVELNTRKLKPSQRCPACWSVRKKALSERIHDCGCGLSMERDAASAWVMIKEALGLGDVAGTVLNA